jgi:hypothetical protein
MQCREIAYWNVMVVMGFGGNAADSATWFEHTRTARRDRVTAERSLRHALKARGSPVKVGRSALVAPIDLRH